MQQDLQNKAGRPSLSLGTKLLGADEQVQRCGGMFGMQGDSHLMSQLLLLQTRCQWLVWPERLAGVCMLGGCLRELQFSSSSPDFCVLRVVFPNTLIEPRQYESQLFVALPMLNELLMAL